MDYVVAPVRLLTDPNAFFLLRYNREGFKFVGRSGVLHDVAHRVSAFLALYW